MWRISIGYVPPPPFNDQKAMDNIDAEWEKAHRIVDQSR
jgi:hypothetical protein